MKTLCIGVLTAVLNVSIGNAQTRQETLNFLFGDSTVLFGESCIDVFRLSYFLMTIIGGRQKTYLP
jgi:hypothetical protein